MYVRVSVCVCVWQQTAQKSLQLTKSSQQPCADCDCDAAATAAPKDAGEPERLSLALSLSLTHTHCDSGHCKRRARQPAQRANQRTAATSTAQHAGAICRCLRRCCVYFALLCCCVLRWKLSSLPYFRFLPFSFEFTLLTKHDCWLAKRKLFYQMGFLTLFYYEINFPTSSAFAAPFLTPSTPRSPSRV